MNAREAIRTAEAAMHDIDAIMARAIVRPDPARPHKGRIRMTIAGVTLTLAAIAATVLFAGA